MGAIEISIDAIQYTNGVDILRMIKLGYDKYRTDDTRLHIEFTPMLAVPSGMLVMQTSNSKDIIQLDTKTLDKKNYTHLIAKGLAELIGEQYRGLLNELRAELLVYINEHKEGSRNELNELELKTLESDMYNITNEILKYVKKHLTFEFENITTEKRKIRKPNNKYYKIYNKVMFKTLLAKAENPAMKFKILNNAFIKQNVEQEYTESKLTVFISECSETYRKIKYNLIDVSKDTLIEYRTILYDFIVNLTDVLTTKDNMRLKYKELILARTKILAYMGLC